MMPYKEITQIENMETPLSSEMQNAMDLWFKMYLDRAPWLKEDKVFSLNIPAFICSEVARQVLQEMKWDITGKAAIEGSDETMNPRAQFLKEEFKKLLIQLRQKLEHGMAAGGMVIRPYPKNGHIYFDYTMDWGLYPVAFDDSGDLIDVIFQDIYDEGKVRYTRLERHAKQDDGSVIITNRAFKSTNKDAIGKEVSLSEVSCWSNLEPEVQIQNVNGNLYGWYKVAVANNIDVDSPMGASIYAKATKTIRKADEQYSRFLWEFEATEAAIDVDPLALRPKRDGNGYEQSKLNERLFRAVDLGVEGTYHIFSPNIREASQIAGMNQLFLRIEDQVGLSRGTMSDANIDAKTATELRINKQRSYSTIADNQKALEACLKDVIYAMDVYATLYKLAPSGEYEVSFEWDDSIITDMSAQTQERLMLVNAGLMGKVEFRMWYFGETEAQALAAVQKISAESVSGIDTALDSLGIPSQNLET